MCKLYIPEDKIWISLEDYLCRCTACAQCAQCDQSLVPFQNILVKQYGGITKESNLALEKLDFFLKNIRS